MAELNNQRPVRAQPNYFYSIISVALVLFALGFFGLAVFNARQLVNELKEQISLIVELKPELNREEARSLQELLEKSAFTKEGSATFISKEEAASIMREDFGEDFLKLDLPNPLYDVITFNVRAAYMRPDSLRVVRGRLMEANGVSDVYYQENLVDDIAENVRSISLVAAGALVFFILVAITLIHNTVRLALSANRFLIKNMELVGASWEFISEPYLKRASLHGLLSGLLACAAILGLYLWIQQDIPSLKGLVDWVGLAALFLLLLALGLAINTLSTYYVVRKYLKMRVDDLY